MVLLGAGTLPTEPNDYTLSNVLPNDDSLKSRLLSINSEGRGGNQGMVFEDDESVKTDQGVKLTVIEEQNEAETSS